MAHLEYLEMHLMNTCNLNCKGCSHFSNIATNDDIEPIEAFQKNMSKLASIMPVIYKIRLLGGEPLLNQNLAAYIKVVRDNYPYTDIRIVTNGLLIPSINSSYLEAIRACNIGLDISLYKPTQTIIEKIKTRLDYYNIEYNVSEPILEFRKRMKLDKNPINAYKDSAFN